MDRLDQVDVHESGLGAESSVNGGKLLRKESRELKKMDCGINYEKEKSHKGIEGFK